MDGGTNMGDAWYDESLVDFFVYSRPAIERLPPHDVDHVIVSVTSVTEDRARLPASPHCLGVLRLAFPDADVPGDTITEGELFSEEHADRIWTFVLDHHAEIDRIVAHCDAGMSRSPAIAAAISKALTGDDTEFFRRYRPNMRVYQTLVRVFHGRFKPLLSHQP